MEKDAGIERSWRGRWWSAGCSPRGWIEAVDEDVDGEMGLEAVVSEEQWRRRQGYRD
ncbi:hypothetical protein [Natronococcus wangiae]|uniref:hypothetical protein n=1 Tax=Natronococcus wangiae TaxID=3068275 RepID=UPI00273E9ED4|nr:hypothetical protein [Natronococcus sp. AD5]